MHKSYAHTIHPSIHPSVRPSIHPSIDRLLVGLDEALRRARAFAAAGADILFVEAPESEVKRRAVRPDVSETSEGRDPQWYHLDPFGHIWTFGGC